MPAFPSQKGLLLAEVVVSNCHKDRRSAVPAEPRLQRGPQLAVAVTSHSQIRSQLVAVVMQCFQKAVLLEQVVM